MGTENQKSSGGLPVYTITFAIVGMAVLLTALSTWTASKFGYQAALGEPLMTIGSMRLYAPWELIVWTFKFSDVPSAAEILDKALTLSFGAILPPMAAVFWQLARSRDAGTSNTHGSARWATADEVKKSGLINDPPDGVYVGAFDSKGRQHYMTHDGPEHVLCFAPTRSGKGVGLVLPTLLSWKHSVVVHDIKGENFALTAGFRKSLGQTILKFDPTSLDGSSCKFNPLNEVRLGTDLEIKDVQNLAQMIVTPDGNAKGGEDHWTKTGHALLVGAILHVLYAEQDKTLRGVAAFLSNPARTIEETLSIMLTTNHTPNGPHPVIAQSARDMISKSSNEASAVLSTSMSFLGIYRDPIVARNTESSDFTVTDLMNHDDPVSLYVVVPPSDKDRLKPLVRLMINQIVRRLTESMDFENGRSVAGYKHRLLLMIDEFPALGKLDILAEALAFIAGYGLKAFLITQDLTQLYQAYSRDESIISNCHVRIAYAPNKVETAELLSKMAGVSTVKKRNVSYSGKRSSWLLGNTSETDVETQRPLLTPDEAMRLPPDDSLIFVAGQNPIYGKKIKYYANAIFDARSKMPPPKHSDKIDQPARQAQVIAPSIPTPPTPAALISTAPQIEGDDYDVLDELMS